MVYARGYGHGCLGEATGMDVRDQARSAQDLDSQCQTMFEMMVRVSVVQVGLAMVYGAER